MLRLSAAGVFSLGAIVRAGACGASEKIRFKRVIRLERFMPYPWRTRT